VDQDPVGALDLWTLVIFAVVSSAHRADHLADHPGAELRPGRERLRRDRRRPVNFILSTGLGLGQLAICVLGVLVITSEYSSGTIRASLLATPRRYPMLIAKGLVFGALVFVIGEAVSFGSFIARHREQPLPGGAEPAGVTRAVIGSGLYLTVLGLFALAIGSLIRHTAGPSPPSSPGPGDLQPHRVAAVQLGRTSTPTCRRSRAS